MVVIKMVRTGNLGTGKESIGNQESRDVLPALFSVLFSLELVLSQPFLARAGREKSIAGANWKLIKQGSRAKPVTVKSWTERKQLPCKPVS